MIAAFFHAGQADTFARIAVAAFRATNGCKVLHLTDEVTPGLDGCEVVRLPWDGQQAMVFRALHLAQLEGDVLSLDTDVIVQRDLSGVFDWPFDAALTQRDGPIKTQDGFDLVSIMPFNGGVVFSRSQQFRRDVHAWCEQNKAQDGWYVDQLALAQVAKNYNVLKLHCDNFNYTPRSPAEDVSKRFAVHYKGPRKDWMKAWQSAPTQS